MGTSAPINSWEVGQNTPPPPKHYQFPPEKSQRGFEPYDTLAQSVYTALQANGTIPVKYVTVSAEQGHVHLSGTVETRAQAAQAVHIAQGVSGVKGVQSTLVVRAP